MYVILIDFIVKVDKSYRILVLLKEFKYIYFLKNKTSKFINGELESDSPDKPEYSVDSDKQNAWRLTDESKSQCKSRCISKKCKVS